MRILGALLIGSTLCAGCTGNTMQPQRQPVHAPPVSIHGHPVALEGPGGLWVDVGDTNKQLIAAETAKRVAASFPPTRYLLSMDPVHDGFGLALLRNLRDEGFAILYSGKEAPGGNNGANRPVPLNPAEPARHVRFALDGIDPTLIRVVVWVGDQSFTRAYMKHGPSLVATSGWLFLE